MLDSNQGFVYAAVWINDMKLDRYYPSEAAKNSTCAVSSSSGSDSSASCENPDKELITAKYLTIEPYYTNVFTSSSNNTDYIGFSGQNGEKFEIHTFDLRTGALTASASVN